MMRLLTTFLGMLLFVSAANAQDITGIWIQSEEQSNGDKRLSLCKMLSLQEDGRLEKSVVLSLYKQDSACLDNAGFKLRMSYGGKWQYSEGTLSQTLDAQSLKTEVLEKPDNLSKALINMFSRKISSEFKKQAGKTTQIQVITLTSDTLKIRFADDKDGKEETYTRQ